MAWYDNLGLMPGESSGIPNNTGFQGQIGGLLSGENPLFNLGLGILANNTSKNFGQVIGRGAQQGMQMTQQQQQLARQNKMQDLQTKRYEREGQKYDAEEAAHNDFDAKFPQYKGLSRLDPKAAIKLANPDFASNTADPYTSIQYDAQGNAYLLNQRETDPTKALKPITIDGRPFTGAKYSPDLAGSIKQAEAGGTAAYKVDTSIPGQVLTSKQVAQMADPSLGGLPQGVPPNTPMLPQGAPQGNFSGNPQAIMSQINRIRDPQERASATAAFNQQFGQQPIQPAPMSNSYGGGGVRIPTPAEQAADKARAELQAETQVKAQANLPNAIQEGTNTVKLVDDLLSSKGFKQAVGGSRMFGLQNIPGTSAKDFDVRLDQLKGKQFLQAYESLKGAGAITDIEGTKAGNAISRMDASQSEEEFQKAAREFQDVIRAGVERAKAKAGGGAIMPPDEQMPAIKAMPLPAKPSSLTLKKGQVYATPKGNLKWNGREFED